jgi:glycerophosphoryl diester phosphodiesterase
MVSPVPSGGRIGSADAYLERRMGARHHRDVCDPYPVTPITFAHRGARTEEPENSLPAFRRALALGAAGLETDAWLSADGHVVLVHDETVRRGLRRYRVGATSADRLVALGVPRLSDLYEELGTGFELSVDVKGRGAGEALLATARAAGDDARSRLWVCSPSVRYLTRLRDDSGPARLVHSSRRRRLTQPLERHAADLATLGVDAINLHYSEWTEGLVVLFHRFGVRALAWDVQETRHLRAMLDIGIDGLYSDHVERMVKAVNEWERASERRER